VFSGDSDEHCVTVGECVAHHTSHVTRHTSHVTRHTSHVTQVYDLDDWLSRGGSELNQWLLRQLNATAAPAGGGDVE
jgi:hypothetical protein